MEITRYFNYDTRFNVASSRNNLNRIKDGAYVTNLDDRKAKHHIGFHYFITEIHLYTLTLLSLNILLKKY